MVKRAIVLAAGFGTRMRPITDTIPKPLVPVHGITLLDRILDKLDEAGIEQVVVNSHYLAPVLHNHIAKRLETRPRHPHITISHEEDILETGGGIVKALPLLGDEPFLVINGDVMWLDGPTPALTQLISQWNADIMDALLLLHPREKAIGYEGEGDFILQPDGTLIRPEKREQLPFVFAGLSIITPGFMNTAPSGAFSLSQIYWQRKQENNQLRRMKGIIHQGEWLHIGTPEGLVLAENYISQHA